MLLLMEPTTSLLWAPASAGHSALSHHQVNTTLLSLDLGSNIIDYEGAAALAEALSQNQVLEELILR